MTPTFATLGSSLLAGLPGQWEWLIILFIILILFGSRLPKLARSLGQGISSFKKGLNEPLDEKSDKDDGETAKGESTKSKETSDA